MLRKTSIATAFFATIAVSHAGIGVEQVAKGFERPVWAGVPKGIKGKLWVMEQGGKVWIVDDKTGEHETEPFLDVSQDVTRKGNEEGLLGLAFAPDFAKSGRFYVDYTDKEKQTRIVRFTSKDGKTTDHATEEIILKYPSEFENHNGGWIAFGPDNMLYIGNGDGGAGDDPNKHGQALDTLLAKILRIDVSPEKGYNSPSDNPFVNNKEAKPEIWAYGVRNPWRCSFDRETGDFWIGDVGQNRWEEIDCMPKGTASGANFGWSLREADKQNPNDKRGGPLPDGATDPVYSYNHGMKENEGLSVTGGYVYRGPIKELQGRYVFGDYQNPRIWSFELKNGKASDFKDHTKELQPEGGRINLISSFAEDNDGNLLIVDHTGPIYRVKGN
ncbi:MAG: PQQ-dependent sugar dehydrogenase [Luteolibacter sp.]|uniref:PQQ-dependent sugar dehydrogenase n=1 Tax=Luteolibacter sp. TaxID=1962973 RepID=UPI003264CB65